MKLLAYERAWCGYKTNYYAQRENEGMKRWVLELRKREERLFFFLQSNILDGVLGERAERKNDLNYIVPIIERFAMLWKFGDTMPD